MALEECTVLPEKPPSPSLVVGAPGAGTLELQGLSTEAPTSNFQRVHGREGQANFFFLSPASVRPDDCLVGSHPGNLSGPAHKHSSLNPVPNWHLPAEIDDLNISFGVLSCFPTVKTIIRG